jgi:hypothetical protein
MSAARNRKEREFWSRQLDTTSSEEVQALPKRFQWIDADEPGDLPKQRPAEPSEWTSCRSMWDV